MNFLVVKEREQQDFMQLFQRLILHTFLHPSVNQIVSAIWESNN